MNSQIRGVRTRDELVAILRHYMEITGISPYKLSAFALGESSKLNRILRNPHHKVSLDTVDRLLSYIESNPAPEDLLA